MQILIEVITGLAKFVAVCVGMGVLYIVFIIAREVGWQLTQESRRGKQGWKKVPCDFCGLVGSYIAVIDIGIENRLFINISGGYLQIYDDDCPGVMENVKIDYCPKCGRELVGGKEDEAGGV